MALIRIAYKSEKGGTFAAGPGAILVVFEPPAAPSADRVLHHLRRIFHHASLPGNGNLDPFESAPLYNGTTGIFLLSFFLRFLITRDFTQMASINKVDEKVSSPLFSFD